MSSDAAMGHDPLPLGDAAPESAGASADGDPWDDGVDALGDGVSNWFSAEIENVNASDWEADADAIWGDDGAASDIAQDFGLDFPL